VSFFEALADREARFDRPSTVPPSLEAPGRAQSDLAQARHHDTITFDSHLLFGTLELTSGELPINQNVTIQGLGLAGLTIGGNHASRVIEIRYRADVLGQPSRASSSRTPGGSRSFNSLALGNNRKDVSGDRKAIVEMLQRPLYHS
jgi:hypothetical protein